MSLAMNDAISAGSEEHGPPPSSAGVSMDESEGDEGGGGGPQPSPSSSIHRMPKMLSSRSPSTDAGEAGEIEMDGEDFDFGPIMTPRSTGEIFLPPNFKMSDCILPIEDGGGDAKCGEWPLKSQNSDTSLVGGSGERALDLGHKLFIYGGYRDKFLYLFGSQISSEAKRKDFTIFLRTSGILQLISKFILGLEEMEFRPPPEQVIEFMIKSTGTKLVIRDIMEEMKTYRDDTKKHVEELQKESEELRLRLEKYSTVYNPYEVLDPDDFSNLAFVPGPDSGPNPFEWLSPSKTIQDKTPKGQEVEVVHLAKSKSKSKSKKGKKGKKGKKKKGGKSDDELSGKSKSKTKSKRGKKTPKSSPSTATSLDPDLDDTTSVATSLSKSKSKSKSKGKGKKKASKSKSKSSTKSKKSKKGKKGKKKRPGTDDEGTASGVPSTTGQDMDEDFDDGDLELPFPTTMLLRRPKTPAPEMTDEELANPTGEKADLDLEGLFTHFRALGLPEGIGGGSGDKEKVKKGASTTSIQTQVGGGGDCGNLPQVDMNEEDPASGVGGGDEVNKVNLPPLILTQMRKYTKDGQVFYPPAPGQIIKPSSK